MKKTLLLFVVMVLISAGLMAETVAVAPTSGDGSEATPYEIANLANLRWLSETQSVWTNGTYFIQTADINAAETSTWNGGVGFSPIGNSDSKFSGVYNGGGHIIDSLFINRIMESNIGLFGYMQGAKIFSLGMQHSKIHGKMYVGGITGMSWQSEISNCYNAGNISAQFYLSGGIAGRNDTGTIQNCYNTGIIAGKRRVGGITGYNYGSAQIINCYNLGKIIGTSEINGIAGYNYSLNCTITNCFNNTDSCANSANSTGLSTEAMKQGQTYYSALWDFMDNNNNGTDDIWGLNPNVNNSYPFLAWQGYENTSDFEKPVIASIPGQEILKPANVNTITLPDYSTLVKDNTTDNFTSDKTKFIISQTPAARTIISGSLNTISVTATDEAGLVSDQVQFNVAVINKAPIFSAIPNNINIDENSGEGVQLVDLGASDENGDDISFSLVNADLDNNSIDDISIDASTGVVTIANAAYFDAEINTSIIFNVKVSDGTMEDTESVKIAINNVNDNNPVFNAIASDLSINENSAVGTELLTISASDADGNLNTLSYSTTETKVAVDATTGKVTILDATYFDAETNTSITFNVKVSDGINEDTEAVRIAINNLNDNAPILETIAPDLNIDENSTAGTELLTLAANDADSALNTLTFSTTETKVAINATTGVVTIADSAYFNFEVNTSLVFDVKVSDGLLEDTETIAITINDINEAPIFKNIANNLNINENSPIGTELLTLSATDVEGDELIFSTTETKVSINATTGKVTIADAAYFDSETNTSISFDVKVSDGTNEDTETVTIAINNMNDNSPVLGTIAANLSVNENSAAGTELLILTASDADGALNTLTFSTTETKVAINASTGVVTITDAAYFDAETHTSITFNVKVSDGTNEDTESVTIAINNVNDNNPALGPIASNLSINENSETGTELLTLTANDADGNLNTLTFSTSETKVAVDAATGKVTITDAAYFDAETNTSITFNVKVSDGTNEDTETVNIAIKNINDNNPVLGTIAANLSVNENSAAGTELLTLSATDGDGALNALTFSTTETKVAVNATTGIITIADAAYFDAETNENITFDVKVSDGTHEDSETVIIAINNINDNNPVLGAITSDLSIDENSAAGTVLLTLSATDADGALNALTFSTTETKVAVNATTGIITIADAAYFDAETNENITFNVKVSDGTNEDTESVTIAINNVNDNNPVFDENSYAFEIRDNVAAGTAVGAVSGTDADNLGALNFSIPSTVTAFVIDPTSGAITVADQTALKQLSGTTADITITISDGENTSDVTCLITVLKTTGINDIDIDNAFKVYPNPNNGVFTIKVNESTQYGAISIINMVGSVIYQTVINGMEQGIDISDFGKGFYFVKFESEGKVHTKKIILR